jgi:signal transduction histidine kinase/streptogramin lyase
LYFPAPFQLTLAATPSLSYPLPACSMRRKLTPKIILLSLICLGFALCVRAERLSIRIFTSADGLGSSFVNYLMRDSRGFMWFCTRDGLSRFDGARFITYRVSDKNAPPGIEGITETSGGVYWITTTGGLYRFRADALSQPDKRSGAHPFLNTEFIDKGRGSVFEDRHNNLWYVADDLYRMRAQNGKVAFEKASLNLPANPNRPLTAFLMREAPDGSLWISTNHGVVRRLPDGRVILYHHETDIRSGSSSMIIDASGRVWVNWWQDFYIIKPPPLAEIAGLPGLSVQPLVPTYEASKSEQKIHLPEHTGEILQLELAAALSLPRRLFQTADGHVWLTLGDSLVEFDGNNLHSYGAEQGLPTSMSEMGEDSAGNLWIGGQASLLRLDRRGLTRYTEADGLASPRLIAISEGADGSLYFANGDFYLSRFDGKKFLTFRPQIAANARALWSSRYAFLSSANEWWILTTDRLYRFAASNLRKPLATYDSHNGLSANEAFQVFEDSHGDIWLSQQPAKDENFGLYRLKRGEEQFFRFSKTENLPGGKSASSFAEDNYGNLWFGFYEGGLVRFANNRFQEFTTKDGLASGVILDLHVDRKGHLWLASSSDGLRKIDDPGAEKPTFKSLTTDDGLSSNNARTITEDHLGNVYAGTVRGVDRISPETGRIKHYSVSDGLAGDFVVDSHCDNKGVLWFATTNGLSRLVPTVEEGHAPPRVLLGGLRIAGEEQAVSELGDAQIQTQELAATRNNLQIDFFGLDFQPGETLRYQFMLEGADSEWSPPTEQRTVTYANLKPGSYRFLVRAVNADGMVSEKPALVAFKILSPIWLRWWFLALATLLILCLFYAFYRYRMARLREVNAALREAKLAEENLRKANEERLVELERVRKRIATDLHDDIGSSLTRISLLSEVTQLQGRQVETVSGGSLSVIAGLSRELVDSMSDIVWAINPERDSLGDLTQRMRHFASDVFSARGIDFRFSLPDSERDLRVGANFRRELFLIFKEAVNNAVRHSGCTKAEIEFRMDGEGVFLRLTDNGRGFDPHNDSMGHGLKSMRERIEAFSGKLEIASNPGAGTALVFTIPIIQLDGVASPGPSEKGQQPTA